MPVLEGTFDIIKPVSPHPLFKEVEPFISTYKILCRTMIYKNKQKQNYSGG